MIGTTVESYLECDGPGSGSNDRFAWLAVTLENSIYNGPISAGLFSPCHLAVGTLYLGMEQANDIFEFENAHFRWPIRALRHVYNTANLL